MTKFEDVSQRPSIERLTFLFGQAFILRLLKIGVNFPIYRIISNVSNSFHATGLFL